MADFRDEEKHPAWGMIQFNRVQGSTNLFGSHLDHQHFISMKVSPAKRSHGYGKDWYTASHHHHIEVWMSAAQFAEAITTLNSGPGAPCTIRAVAGVDMPLVEAEMSEAKRSFEDSMDSLEREAKDIDSIKEAMKAILEKPSIGKADRALLIKQMDNLAYKVKGNLPFYIDQYQRATTKISAQAKAEFESYYNHHLMQVGLKTLKVDEAKRIENGKEA